MQPISNEGIQTVTFKVQNGEHWHVLGISNDQNYKENENKTNPWSRSFYYRYGYLQMKTNLEEGWIEFIRDTELE